MFRCNTVIELRVSRASWHFCYSIEFLLVQSGSAGRWGSRSAGHLKMKYMPLCVSYKASVTERTVLLL